MKPIHINRRKVGPGRATFVIAEIGVNHDGSLVRALELVRLAKECGADAVKLQVFSARSLMHASSSFASYQKDRCADADPSAMLRKYELPDHALREIVGAVRNLAMVPLATPFSPADVETIESLDLPAVKIASPDLVNRVLLQRAAATGRPLLISAGAATMDEVSQAVGWLRSWNTRFALLHCVSSYPTPTDQANLCWIGEMASWFDVPIGYSDHTTEVHSGAIATAFGACIIEKHLTYDRTAPGPDHAASADPQQFAQYIALIRSADAMRGASGKRVLDIERDVRKVSRQSLVLARPLGAGEVVSESDVTVQRPGTGIPAAKITMAIGKRTARPLAAGTLLTWDMLADAA
ncbi:MAG TPA: N-acetylneuraminate synthase family protein [Tepidisphaeraceae bacterium]|nr:N-acetylneuraminate synthase family protein [Tepidisphaeraceae bacterium]